MNFIDFLFLFFSAPTFLIVGMAMAAYTNTKHVNSRKNVINQTADMLIPSKVHQFAIHRNRSLPTDDEIIDVTT